MKLKELFEGIPHQGQLPEGETELVTIDSRKVCPGAVFVCTRGGGLTGTASPQMH